MQSRLQEHYKKTALPSLMSKFGYSSVMQAPSLVKVTVNMGLGEAIQNSKVLETALAEVQAITGQKPVITRAKKSIAAFKLREGMPIGVMVTLRRGRMWHFLDRFISLALPQVRDFRGISRRSFDGHGNYTLGVREQIIFPEISFDDIDAVRGMNITLHTSARTDEEALHLLENIGFPFRKQ
ncbi:MAG: 50S ribosomal protein L5 [Deltaproteobacteria bacterium]|nr:50S ribosomal protein L5 [Deltaproteobacteria bacterium]